MQTGYVVQRTLFLLTLMTVSFGFPHHATGVSNTGYSRTATARYDAQRHRRSDHQVQVAASHDDSRHKRLEHSQDVGRYGVDGGHRRVIHKRHDRPTARPQWEQTTETNRAPGTDRRDDDPQHSSHGTHQSRSPSEWDRRSNTDEDCDETAGSQAQRRSASQDTDTKSQHTVRNTSLCRPKPRNPGTLPRPPTTTPTNATRGPEKALGDIVFPDGNLFPTFVPRKVACEGTTFCDLSDDYPVNHISEILKHGEEVFRGMFGTDEVEDPGVKNRIDQSEDSPLCPSTEQVVFPKNAQNKENKWLFVVNQAPFLQGVRVETCLKEGACQLTDSLPIGYKTFCKQKYIYRKMLGLNEQGEAASDSFKLPSCCTCHVKMDPVARMSGLTALPKNMTPAKKKN